MIHEFDRVEFGRLESVRAVSYYTLDDSDRSMKHPQVRRRSQMHSATFYVLPL